MVTDSNTVQILVTGPLGIPEHAYFWGLFYRVAERVGLRASRAPTLSVARERLSGEEFQLVVIDAPPRHEADAVSLCQWIRRSSPCTALPLLVTINNPGWRAAFERLAVFSLLKPCELSAMQRALIDIISDSRDIRERQHALNQASSDL